MNDLDLPIPEGEEDLLAEFHRIRKEYNSLSKKNPDHTPRRMELKSRYRELDKRLGQILKDNTPDTEDLEEAKQTESETDAIPSPTPFVPLDDVPADAGLASTDPFSTDDMDSLFSADAFSTGEGGTSLLEEIIGNDVEGEVEATAVEADSDSVSFEVDEAGDASGSDAFQFTVPLPNPLEDEEETADDEELVSSIPPLSDVDVQTAEDEEETADDEDLVSSIPPLSDVDVQTPTEDTSETEAADDSADTLTEETEVATMEISPDPIPMGVEEFESEPVVQPDSEATSEVIVEPLSAAEQFAALANNLNSELKNIPDDTIEDLASEPSIAIEGASTNIDEISATFLEESAELLKTEDESLAEPEEPFIGSPFDVDANSNAETDAPVAETSAEPHEPFIASPFDVEVNSNAGTDAPLAETSAAPALPDLPSISIDGLGELVESDFNDVIVPVSDTDIVDGNAEIELPLEAVKAEVEPVYTSPAQPIRRPGLLGLNGAAMFTRLGWLIFVLGSAIAAAFVVPDLRDRVLPVLEDAGLNILTQDSNGLLIGGIVMFLGGAFIGIGSFVDRGRGRIASSPLHEIVAGGTPEDIRAAVAAGKSLEESDSRGHNALHAAVVVKRQDMAAALIEQGSDLETKTHKGETPLLLAVKGADLDMAEFLIDQGADLQTQNNRESNLMHVGAWAGDVRLLCLLEQKGLSVNSQALTGYTPLHFAAQGGHLDAVRSLVEMKSDINAMSVKGNTPMYAAAKNGHTATVALLVESGADPNIQKERGGHSPLSIAMENGHVHVIAYLKEHGAAV